MWQPYGPSPEALLGRGDELLGDLLAARCAADEEAEVDAPADLVAHQLVEAAREACKTVVLQNADSYSRSVVRVITQKTTHFETESYPSHLNHIVLLGY